MNSEPKASNKYNSYDQLDFAAIACKNDSECIGIYDESCDGKGPFQHIRRGFKRSSHSPNCIHQKEGNDGKHICAS